MEKTAFGGSHFAIAKQSVNQFNPFSLAFWDYVSGIWPCTMGIWGHFDEFAGGTTCRTS